MRCNRPIKDPTAAIETVMTEIVNSNRSDANTLAANHEHIFTAIMPGLRLNQRPEHYVSWIDTDVSLIILPVLETILRVPAGLL
ncbi:hypothetical protein SAMN05216196_1011115 [Lutimaribacter pacificus]|uniref:Uncharacterized protein n=1 Tax=Lutimaribacter pacificus TaxID=391948 RepID=A0A1H0CY98_9RHOB|nr:hypothetical protein [Lutimaribacter pacificus]SDN62776.1 hypothetical protein SAMN05216196_1011115 [Lutimaribacter pacificus]SHJ39344.1 hypothetical protein SAMN05444142_101102 [Lutimaribacter pacificus]